MSCSDVRDVLALNPDDPACADHLAGCAECRAYQRRYRTLDTLLHTELRPVAPADLTSRLLALIPGAAGLQSAGAPPAPALPPRWYVALIYALTALAVGLSLAFAWDFYQLLNSQLGLEGAVALIREAPAIGLQYLLQALPQAAPVVDVLLRIREQLSWLLLAALLWAVVDGWTPRWGRARSVA